MSRPFGLPEKRRIVLPGDGRESEPEPQVDAVSAVEEVDESCPCLVCRIVAETEGR